MSVGVIRTGNALGDRWSHVGVLLYHAHFFFSIEKIYSQDFAKVLAQREKYANLEKAYKLHKTTVDEAIKEKEEKPL